MSTQSSWSSRKDLNIKSKGVHKSRLTVDWTLLAKKDTFLLRLYYTIIHTHTHTHPVLFDLIFSSFCIWLLLFLFPSAFSLCVLSQSFLDTNARARLLFHSILFFTFHPVSREREIRESRRQYRDCKMCVCWGVYPSRPCRRHTTTRKNKQWNVHSFIYRRRNFIV